MAKYTNWNPNQTQFWFTPYVGICRVLQSIAPPLVLVPLLRQVVLLTITIDKLSPYEFSKLMWGYKGAAPTYVGMGRDLQIG